MVWKNQYGGSTRRYKSLRIDLCLLVSTAYTNVTDGQTDRRTPHDDLAALMHSLARQQKLALYRHVFIRCVDKLVVDLRPVYSDTTQLDVELS